MSNSDRPSRYTAASCVHPRTVAMGRGFSGNAAALRAGCRLADPADVDQAATRAALAFLALRRRTRKASGEMRAVLLPYVQAAQS